MKKTRAQLEAENKALVKQVLQEQLSRIDAELAYCQQRSLVQ